MSVLEWRRERHRILLPVQILPPFPVSVLTGVEATALLDTGSSISGVALSLAEKLGLHRLGKLPLTSAQGLGQVERYAFRVGLAAEGAGRAPSFPFVFDEVVGIELTNSFEFNALIGMDVLDRCDFSTERTGRCSLSSVEGRNRRVQRAFKWNGAEPASNPIRWRH